MEDFTMGMLEEAKKIADEEKYIAERTIAIAIDYGICGILSITIMFFLIPAGVINPGESYAEVWPFALPMLTAFSFFYFPKIVWLILTSRNKIEDMEFEIEVLIILGLTELIYFILTQIFLKRTLGQKLKNIEIFNVNHRKVGLRNSIVRGIIKTISKYLLFIPFLIALFNDKERALHDVFAKTVVKVE
jgi:uncharacterized RDD family membrane protein YckC